MSRATYIEQLQWGVDHIESRLDGDVAVAEVARAAGLSRWHFQRIFTAVTGETLMTYIRGRRLSLACHRLATTDSRVIDIAFLAGFNSHEAFTRAFKKSLGITPTAYRRQGASPGGVKKVQFDSDYLEHITTSVSMEPRIEHFDAMVMVGAQTRFYGTGSERNNIAEQVPPLWEAFLPRSEEISNIIPGTGYGIIAQEDSDSEQLIYQAAWAVSEVANVPLDMTTHDIDAAMYAVFSHRGDAANLDHTVNYAYSTWLTQSGHRHTGGPDLEIFGNEYNPEGQDSVIHYAMPIAG